MRSVKLFSRYTGVRRNITHLKAGISAHGTPQDAFRRKQNRWDLPPSVKRIKKRTNLYRILTLVRPSRQTFIVVWAVFGGISGLMEGKYSAASIWHDYCSSFSSRQGLCKDNTGKPRCPRQATSWIFWRPA